MKRLLTGLGVALFVTAYPALALAQSNLEARKTQSSDLAKRIDKHINARLQAAKLKPGVKADWQQLTRRAHIDITGRIPNMVQLIDMIDPGKDSQVKLEERIDALLDSSDYAINFASYWRSIMLRSSNLQQRGPLQQFENWMRGPLQANTTFDKIARDIISGQGQQGGAIFTQFNQNKAESLAGSTARIFLGVKMECAECHNHPFAEWTRDQFWEFAAFFVNQAGVGRKVPIPMTQKIVVAKFLNGEEPKPAAKNMPMRTVLANWVASPANPWFAKATVDHVWQYFFGVSLCEPIFEPNESSPPAHPALLEDLAKGFIDSNFDLKTLIRAIMLTDAYQRKSVVMSEANKTDIQWFAKMPMRGMSPEQLYDCVLMATEYRKGPSTPANPGNKGKKPQPPQDFGRPGGGGGNREQFLDLFRNQDHITETQTSVLQALYLMNGQFVTQRTQQAAQQIFAVPNSNTQQRVEALYIMVLSRLPRPSELDQMVKFIDNSKDARQALADMCWVLINSSEFMLNH